MSGRVIARVTDGALRMRARSRSTCLAAIECFGAAVPIVVVLKTGNLLSARDYISFSAALVMVRCGPVWLHMVPSYSDSAYFLREPRQCHSRIVFMLKDGY